MYTLTKRLDIPIQECFVGTTVGPAHYIMEAGAHCQRGKQPSEHGMVMTQEREPYCDIVEEIASAAETTSSRPVSPRVSLVSSSNEVRGHHLHSDHRSPNHHPHHSRPETSSQRSSTAHTHHQPHDNSGQTALNSSLTVIGLMTLFFLTIL